MEVATNSQEITQQKDVMHTTVANLPEEYIMALEEKENKSEQKFSIRNIDLMDTIVQEMAVLFLVRKEMELHEARVSNTCFVILMEAASQYAMF